MMTVSPKVASGSGTASSWEYTYDTLGNRLSRNMHFGTTDTFAQGMVWDEVNRLKRVASPTAGAGFTYRADGMRTEKVSDVTLQYVEDEETASGMYDWNYAVNKPTTRFYYDGQMPVEEDYAEIVPNEDPFYEVTRYGLGARGVDMIERETLEDTIASYPIYDGHGNMVCTLTKSGSSYATSNWRYYDVWGGVNSGSSTGVPANRYVANLGHQQDDESGLVYMRARYYEPWTGRFVSQDPAMAGGNWFGYCHNDPVNFADGSGRAEHSLYGVQGLFAALGYTLIFSAHVLVTYAHDAESIMFASQLAAWAVVAMSFAFILGDSSGIDKAKAGIGMVSGFVLLMLSAADMAAITTMTAAAAIGAKTTAHKAVTLSYGYCLVLMAIMLGANFLDEISHTNFFSMASGGGH